MTRRTFGKRFSRILAIALCVGLMCSNFIGVSASPYNNFIRGVDVSSLKMLEDLGAEYYYNGTKGDALAILKNNGANYVRLKLWVDPYDAQGNPYGGGT